MGADDAHEADDTQEGHADRGDEGGQQHGQKAQQVHMDAHGSGGGFAAEEGVVLPGHDLEIEEAAEDHHSHDGIGAVGGPAQVAEAPYHSRGQAHVGGVILQDGGGGGPYGAEGQAGQNHHIGREGPDGAQAQNQQDGHRCKGKGHEAGGVGIGTHGEIAQVIAGGEIAPGEGDDGEVGTEDRRIGHAQSGGGCHGIVQAGLHDQARDGKACTGDGGGQHPGDADVPDDAHLGGGAGLVQSGDAIGEGHIGRANEQTEKAQRHHGHSHDQDDEGVSSALNLYLLDGFHEGAILLWHSLAIIAVGGGLRNPPGGIFCPEKIEKAPVFYTGALKYFVRNDRFRAGSDDADCCWNCDDFHCRTLFPGCSPGCTGGCFRHGAHCRDGLPPHGVR